MKLLRTLRHLTASGWTVRRAFDAAALSAIERAIAESERNHGGEIQFVIEAALDAVPLWRGMSARDRALQVFAQQGLWDTEANNGVLIYVLWADHDVEIIADRGFNNKVTAQEWSDVCRRMETLFANNEPVDAVIEGIRAAGALIARHYPASDHNEVPDRAVIL